MANQAFFRVTPQQMMNTASGLETLGTTYKGKITAISNARGQLNSQWKSDANKEFDRICLEYEADMQKILELIGRYRTSLETIAKNYESAERRNVEIARRK